MGDAYRVETCPICKMPDAHSSNRIGSAFFHKTKVDKSILTLLGSIKQKLQSGYTKIENDDIEFAYCIVCGAVLIYNKKYSKSLFPQ